MGFRPFRDGHAQGPGATCIRKPRKQPRGRRRRLFVSVFAVRPLHGGRLRVVFLEPCLFYFWRQKKNFCMRSGFLLLTCTTCAWLTCWTPAATPLAVRSGVGRPSLGCAATARMAVFAKGTSLGDLCASGFSLSTYNVLLPNSVDGWWIYKYYQKHVPMEQRMWPCRSELLKTNILSGGGADIVCVQVLNPKPDVSVSSPLQPTHARRLYSLSLSLLLSLSCSLSLALSLLLSLSCCFYLPPSLSWSFSRLCLGFRV